MVFCKENLLYLFHLIWTFSISQFSAAETGCWHFLLIHLEGHDWHEAAIAILPRSMVQTSPKVPQRNGPRGMDETRMG